MPSTAARVVPDGRVVAAHDVPGGTTGFRYHHPYAGTDFVRISTEFRS